MRVPFRKHILFGFITLTLLQATPVLSNSDVMDNPEAPFSIKVQYERFEWKEFALNGDELLEESGYRLGLRWDKRNMDWSTPNWSADALLYFGDVDYDGQSQLGEPVESTTEYYGGRGESFFHIPVSQNEQRSSSLLLGGGIHSWLRRLDNTGGFTDTDYDEWWISTYLQAGVGVRWKSRRGVWTGRTGIRYPFYNRVEFDFVLPDGSTGTSVEPESDAGYFAEIECESGGYVFGIFLEEWNFKRSDTKNTGGAGVFQPESKQQSAGVQFGLSF